MVTRETAERALRRAVQVQAPDADALSETDIAEIARNAGVAPEHVWRALEHERRMEWVQEAVRRKHVREAWRPLALTAAVFGAIGVYGLASLVAYLENVRRPLDWVGVVLLGGIAGLCFWPTFLLLAAAVRAWRLREP
jgi:hypothetical protein